MEYKGKFNPYHHEPKKGISWRAVFAGTVTVLSIMLVLNLIGMAIGFGSIDPVEDANPMSGIGTGTIIWWVISNLIALFAGGFVAARVGVSFTNTSGIIQGVLTWALYAVVSLWMLTTVVGTIISGVGSAVGGVITTTGQVAGDALTPMIERQVGEIDLTLDEAKEEFYSLLEEAGVDTDDLEADMQATVTRGLRDGNVERAFRNARSRLGVAIGELDREALIDVLVERTDMSRNEAQNAVDNVLAEYDALKEDVSQFMEDAEETVREQAGHVADAAAKAAAYLSIALFIGALVAAFGGLLGVHDLRDDYERNYVDPDDYVPGPRTKTSGYSSTDYADHDPDRADHSTMRTGDPV
ncbi:MAG: YrzE family protein, partial [Cyclonatronaceae bacterium]